MGEVEHEAIARFLDAFAGVVEQQARVLSAQADGVPASEVAVPGLWA